MSETRRQARRAGLLYLILAVIAPIGLLYVPGKLIVRGDAAATAERIRTSESLLRLGIGSELAHQALAVFLVLALYPSSSRSTRRSRSFSSSWAPWSRFRSCSSTS